VRVARVGDVDASAPSTRLTREQAHRDPVRFFDAATIRRALPWQRIIDAQAQAFRENVHAPLRAHHRIDVPGEPAASLLLMPAWRETHYLGVKLVTVFPGNAARDRPSVAALYVLFDARDGRPLAVFDGEEITARRTAAASALAARFLARGDARHLVMVGAGRQARGLIEAHASVRPIERVSVWSRTPERASDAASAVEKGGMSITVCTDLERAVREADIVSCATLSTAPLVLGAWLRPGTHLDLVGAFRPDMRETDDDAMRRADTIVVDERRAALAEGGDIVQAITAGAIDESSITAELSDLARGAYPGRTRAESITVFKSVGLALEDLAAAETVLEAAASRRDDDPRA